MSKKIKSPTKRLGVRYGRTVRKRLHVVEVAQRKKYDCPYCGYKGTVKWIAPGIWQCSKCGRKFTSRAFEMTLKPRDINK